jgi:Uma2 family endonuclease
MADDLDAFPDDGNRYEIIDGELIVSATPSRLHQRALFALARLLAAHADALNLEIMVAPTDVRASAKTQVEPDILALPRRFDGRVASRWEPMTRLLLAVEILSPSTAPIDRTLKKELFQSQRVPAYWIVDVDERVVEVWTPDAQHAQIVTDQLAWQPVPNVDPLIIDLPALFSDVHDE